MVPRFRTGWGGWVGARLMVHEGGMVLVMCISVSAGPPCLWNFIEGGGESWSENQMALEINVSKPVHTSNWSALLVGSTFDEGSHFTFWKYIPVCQLCGFFIEKRYILSGCRTEAGNSAFFPPIHNTDLLQVFWCLIRKHELNFYKCWALTQPLTRHSLYGGVIMSPSNLYCSSRSLFYHTKVLK